MQLSAECGSFVHVAGANYVVQIWIKIFVITMHGIFAAYKLQLIICMKMHGQK